MENFKKLLPPLPIRELSDYDKFRKDIIAQRRQEWEVYEKEWERQWKENLKKKSVNIQDSVE